MVSSPWRRADIREEVIERQRLRAFLAAAVTFGVLLGVVGALDRADTERSRRQAEEVVLERLTAVRSRLEHGLNGRLALADALAAYVSARPDVDPDGFATFARGLLADGKDIDYVALAPGGVLRHVYPPGALGPVGADLAADPVSGGAVRQALETGTLTVEGPVRMGTRTSLVGRLPIVIGERSHSPWGLGIVAMNLDGLVHEAGLREGPASLALRVKGTPGHTPVPFFGSETIFSAEPKVLEVHLPGRAWELGAAPAGGWPMRSPMAWVLRGGGSLLALLAALLLFSLMDSPRRLRAAVGRATTALRLSEERLLADIEERRAAEESLARTNQTLRALIQASPLPIVVMDTSDRVKMWNPAAERVFGWPAEEVEGRLLPIIPELKREESAALGKRVMRGERFSAELERQRRDGTPVAVSLSAAPIHDERGSVTGMIAVYQDITEQRRYQEELRRLASFPELNPIPIFEIAPAGRVTYVNPTAGRAFPDLPAKGVAHALVEGLPQLGKKMAREGREQDAREVLLGGRFLEQHITFVPSANRLRVYCLDVTDRKQAESALKAAYDREREAGDNLRALSEMKNAFLAAVSHELRTPLSAVLGFALTLERPDVDLGAETSRQLIGRVAVNARKLERLLADLLDVDRLAHGILRPRRRPTDVAELLQRILEQSDVVGEHPIHLDVDGAVADVDGAKVERIVENLLTNADRHTDPGTPVWVRVRPRDGGILLVVEDAGSGVRDELKQVIFDPFRQGIAGGHAPGTGIGLTLVARFAELHGGRAWVEDRPGGGASFHVLLPGDRAGRAAVAEDAAAG